MYCEDFIGKEPSLNKLEKFVRINKNLIDKFNTECIEEMLRERTTHEIKENCSKQFWLLPNSFTYSSCYIFEDKLNKSLGERIFNSNKKIKSKRYPIFFKIFDTPNLFSFISVTFESL